MLKRAFKPDLLVIIILLTVMNIPLLAGRTPITWDTFNMPYEEFAVTYNTVYFHGALPLWLPYSMYGMPDYFWLAALSVVNLFFIGVGALFRVQNILLLFKLSLVGEQLISVFGMYLLANQIFRKKSTIFLTCAAFMATFSLYRQAQFNFRITYLLPLILFWIVLFFNRKSFVFLWLAGITTVFSVPGSAFYPLVIEFYSIAIFSLVLFLSDFKTGWNAFKFSWRSVIAFSCLLVISLVFLFYFRSFSNGVSIVRDGRTASLFVPVSDFLTHWKSWNPLALAVSFFYGVIPLDVTDGYEFIFYIGLLPLAGVIGAILYQRNKLWYAVLAAAVFLYAVSLRGYLTFAAYFLPYIDITRYIAILGTIPGRTYLILAAGLGLDAELSPDRWKKIGFVLLGFAIAIDILGAMTAPGNVNSNVGYLEILSNPESYTLDFKIFLIRVAGYLFIILAAILFSRFNSFIHFGRISKPVLVNAGLLVITVIDLGLYRFNYEKKIQAYLHISQPQILALPSLQPIGYQEMRLVDPLDSKIREALNNISIFQAVNPYISESFTQFDRCIPESVSENQKFEVFSSSLQPMIENGLVLTSENAPVGLKQIYGCGFPKLRVVSNVSVRPTNPEVLSEIGSAKSLENLLVLSREYSQVNTSINNPAPNADIQVTRFSPNQVSVDVSVAQDHAWLVYSDAYHPDWRVTVNGKPQKIERAYLAFKAVALSKGKNTVVFDYSSQGKRLGYSALAILCGAAALILFCMVLVTLFFTYRI